VAEMNLEYLAGLFDGEGYFSINRRQNRGNEISYRLYASITLRQYSILKEIQEFAGGVVRQSSEATIRHASCFIWTVIGKEAAELAHAIKDKLRAKKQQAELAIQYQVLKNQNRGGQPNSEERWSALEQMYEQMQALNEKGPNRSEEADDCDKSPWQLFQDGLREEEQ